MVSLKRASGALGAISTLSQQATNGCSLWGTLEAPTFPDFLTNNPLVDGKPWGYCTAENCNPHKDAPNTGVTRRYDFTISRQHAAPDGYKRELLMVNGQFPGPVIEANWGDTIEVTLHNNITGPAEGTAFHWHGFSQRETPWYDGTPSVQQCPLAPGTSFTYRFKADEYGSSWYHAHYSAQYSDGAFGPIIIHGPKHAHYDVDLGPVFVSDYYHRDHQTIMRDVMSTSPDIRVFIPTSDNNLINGKGSLNCFMTNATANDCDSNAPLSKFRFQSGKTYLLRLINAGGGAGLQRFSIDGHTLQVIANDFVPIVPYETNIVALGIGQRADVLVKAVGNPTEAYWMRSTLSANCTFTRQPNAKAVVLYEEADVDATPSTTGYPIVDVNCANDDLTLTTPLYPITPDPNPAATLMLDFDFITNGTGHHVYTMNGQTFRANYNNPLLLVANEIANGKESVNPYSPENVVFDFGSNKTIRIVMNNKFASVHPMHMHGHQMHILSEGPGPWDGKTIINPQNPQRRDVQMLRAKGHIVIQIDADNPGVWPFHCHLAWHASMGLYMNILERPDEIRHMQIPQIMQQTCTDWKEWTSRNVVNQIDSGL